MIAKNSTTTKSVNDASLGALLLDSSLISRTNKETYTTKLIECGDYYYLYNFNKLKSKKKKKEKDCKKIDIDYLFKKENKVRQSELGFIEYKNILRSKFTLQRLVKTNENEFKTFITLTFANNITNIDIANKIFNNWCRQIRRTIGDFKYVCVPEFQNRGAVHYHLITNLVVDNDIIKTQNGKENQYDVKYWNKGFTSVFILDNINVVGYLSKYMTKDIDNRLFNKKRYLYSQNLKHPKEFFLNIENEKDSIIINNIRNRYIKKYENSYYSIFDDLIINFTEYKK